MSRVRISLNRMMARSTAQWRRRHPDLAAELADVTSTVLPGTLRDYRSFNATQFDWVAVKERRRLRAELPRTRVDTLWAGLERALRNDAPLEALRAWLQLGVRWDYLPTFDQLGVAVSP